MSRNPLNPYRRHQGLRFRGHTRSLRASRAIEHAAAMGKQAVTMAEWRDAATTLFNAPQPGFEKSCDRLLTAGSVTRVGGRRGSTLYALTSIVREAGEAIDDICNDGFSQALYRIVVDETNRFRRAVGTHEITVAAQQAGLAVPNKHFLRDTLLSLTRKSTISRESASRVALIIRRNLTNARGSTSTYWLPVNSEHAFATVRWRSDNKSESLRHAILATEALLRRPVSRQDLAHWEIIHAPQEILANTRAARLGAALYNLSKKEEPFAGLDHRLREHRNEFTCVGASPLRYSLHLSDTDIEEGYSASRLEDAFVRYQPAREIGSISSLRTTAAVASSVSIQSLADTRATASARLLRASAPDNWSSALDRLESLSNTWQELILSGKERLPARDYANRMYARGVWANQLRRDCEACRKALDPAAGTGGSSACIEVISEHSGVTNQSVIRFAIAAAVAVRGAGASMGMARNVLIGVRRLPRNPAVPPPPPVFIGSRVSAITSPESFVDRPDAILACYQAVGRPLASMLLSSALLVLGYVIRDPAYFAQLYADCPSDERWLKRSLMLAMALLGRAVPLDQLIPDLVDATDVAAACLAAVIANPDTADITIEALYHTDLGSVARDVAQDALGRFRAGLLLSVVG